ncbi:MAG: hypothetical protein S0880_10415 [Actinomycetota bacterium]|nr:hypothetical protein [Actinomycetota bacterium]
MRHWPTAVVGLILLVPIGLGLVQGSMPIEVAGYRAFIMIVVLGLCDHIVVPLASLLVGPRREEGDETDEAEGGDGQASTPDGARRASDRPS